MTVALLTAAGTGSRMGQEVPKQFLYVHDNPKKRGLRSTAASCQLMSMLGERTWFSKGSEKNLKLTPMDDMDIFKTLLNTEKSGWEN